MNRNGLINGAIVTMIIVLAVWGWWYAQQPEPFKVLPVYGHRPSTADSGHSTAEAYHQIEAFQLIDQQGKIFTNQNLKGKIYVADFFFANCRDICPMMTGQLERVYKEFASEPSLCLVSHTVDPERDTVQALADYAQRHGAAYGKWFFLTGEKPIIYKLARESYLLSATQGSGGSDDFVHTQNFALIDTMRRIRGIYDGTDSAEVDKLMMDIRELLKESGFGKR
jgi:protein SCO1